MLNEKKKAISKITKPFAFGEENKSLKEHEIYILLNWKETKGKKIQIKKIGFIAQRNVNSQAWEPFDKFT